MGLMMLAAAQGTTIPVTAEGPRCRGSPGPRIGNYLANRFGEDE